MMEVTYASGHCIRPVNNIIIVVGVVVVSGVVVGAVDVVVVAGVVVGAVDVVCVVVAVVYFTVL